MAGISTFTEWLITKNVKELSWFLVEMDLLPPEPEKHDKWRSAYLETIEGYFLSNGLERYLKQKEMSSEDCFGGQNRLLLSFYDKMFKKQIAGRWSKGLFKNETDATSVWASFVLGSFATMIRWAINYKKGEKNA